MKKTGIYISPTEFASFGELRENRRAIRSLTSQIATRERRPDFYSLSGMLPNPDPILKSQGKDISVYRELRTEPQVGGNIRRRKGAVKALEWGIEKEKAKQRAVSVTEGLFADLDFDRIVSEILDATLFGYQPMEIIWDKVGRYLLPVDVLGKPPEWFHFDEENRLRLRTKDDPTDGELLPARKFLLPRQEPSYDNPYGFPDLSMVFWPTTFKKGGLTFWVQFSEKYGIPWTIGKLPRNATQEEIDELLNQLAEMIQDAVGVIPNDSEVQIVEAAGKGASADVFERLLMFCRSEVNIALLGQNQSTEASANKASAQAGIEVTKDIRDADTGIVVTTCNQLIHWTHEINFGDGCPPLFRMWEQEEVDEIQARRDKLLSDSGAVFTPAYFARAYGLKEGDLEKHAPEENDSKRKGDAWKGKEAAFAEGKEDGFPDQEKLDAALKELTDGMLQAQSSTIAKSVIDMIMNADDYPNAMEKLAKTYPNMETTALESTLDRVMSVAQLWGYASGND
uniref:Mu-like prophage protein gp29 n=1 Tax=Candidatus Kentrum sp. LFY TaxID=2126342 RepID=A0A450WXF6_9GAMM|nr:MAG: Mu-like prophage protein gp29 [Candidatus Kentron sp. LFY]